MFHSERLILKVVLLAVAIAVAFADHPGQRNHYPYTHHPQQYHPQQYHPQPYHFGYGVKDFGSTHFRKEHGDGLGGVRGSYGYMDQHGINRVVHYVADHQGFRAKIKTNEPGTGHQSPAHVKLYAQPMHFPYEHSPYHGHHHG